MENEIICRVKIRMKTRFIYLLFSLMGFLLLFNGDILAYEEDTVDLTAVDQDSVFILQAVEINISPEKINIINNDGSDTLITRAPGYKGGSSFAQERPVILIGDDETVSASDSIRTEIVVIFGDVTVEGYVKGDVYVIPGNLTIREGGSIEGKIVCLGDVIFEPGSHVWGDIEGFNMITPDTSDVYSFTGSFKEIEFNLADFKFFGPPAMLAMIIFLAIIISGVAAITAVLPKPVARVRQQVEVGFIRCFLVGVLLLLALFPLWILIMVTIIGFPIALLVYPFLIVGAFALGAIGVSQYAGFELGRRTTLKYSGHMRTTFAGVILLSSPLILAAFFSFINMTAIAWPLQIANLAVQFVMFSTGLGAIFFSRFGTRPIDIEINPKYSSASRRESQS
jgi:hypothetical protein